jgi:hypothetical protein
VQIQFSESGIASGTTPAHFAGGLICTVSSDTCFFTASSVELRRVHRSIVSVSSSIQALRKNPCTILLQLAASGLPQILQASSDSGTAIIVQNAHHRPFANNVLIDKFTSSTVASNAGFTTTTCSLVAPRSPPGRTWGTSHHPNFMAGAQRNIGRSLFHQQSSARWLSYSRPALVRLSICPTRRQQLP